MSIIVLFVMLLLFIPLVVLIEMQTVHICIMVVQQLSKCHTFNNTVTTTTTFSFV